MKEHSIIHLTDICQPKQWATISLFEMMEEGYPVYGANGKIGFYDKYTHDKETVLITCRGATCGSLNICEPFSYVNGNAMALDNVDESKIKYKFLYYVLLGRGLNDTITGSAQPQITRASLTKVTFPLPPLPEQERIVRLLDEAESLRVTRERANVRMEQFVPALFQEMFGDPAKTEFPIKVLNEIADVVSGIAKGRKFNGQKPVTINYLRVANVQAGYLDLSEIKTIEALPSEVEGLQVRIGDVLLTEGGDFDKLGRGAMLEVDLPNCIHQNHVFRARVNQDYLLPVFFHDYLQTQQAKKYFLSCAKKTTNLASINLTQLRALPVPLPPLAVQREFAARVGAARGVQSAQGKSAGRVEALYQSMLSRAFVGEL